MWVSLAVSMLAHFGIGAARSLFTGRGIWASGRDMFVVGFGVAAVGYLIGEWITRMLVSDMGTGRPFRLLPFLGLRSVCT